MSEKDPSSWKSNYSCCLHVISRGCFTHRLVIQWKIPLGGTSFCIGSCNSSRGFEAPETQRFLSGCILSQTFRTNSHLGVIDGWGETTFHTLDGKKKQLIGYKISHCFFRGCSYIEKVGTVVGFLWYIPPLRTWDPPKLPSPPHTLQASLHTLDHSLVKRPVFGHRDRRQVVGPKFPEFPGYKYVPMEN